MADKQTVYLAVEPHDVKEALTYGAPLAIIAYKIGEEGHLLRNSVPLSTSGGLMVISGADPSGVRSNLSILLLEIARECRLREYSGVIAAFEEQADSALFEFVTALSDHLSQRKLSLYIPEGYAQASESAKIMISSAVSGGSLDLLLREASSKYGPRLALQVERNSEDFLLPSPDGAGVPLTNAELERLIKELKPSVFFSPELCTHYFTYKDRGGKSHFVLFDNAGSIKMKLGCAEKNNIGEAFLLYPEVSDILGRIF